MYLAKGSEQLELCGYRSWDGRNVIAPARVAAMSKKSHVHLSDLAGLNRMVTDITVELTDLVDALHKNIACSPGIRGTPMQERTSAIASLVYDSIRGITRLVGGTTDDTLAQLGPILDEKSSPEREAVLAALKDRKSVV